MVGHGAPSRHRRITMNAKTTKTSKKKPVQIFVIFVVFMNIVIGRCPCHLPVARGDDHSRR